MLQIPRRIYFGILLITLFFLTGCGKEQEPLTERERPTTIEKENQDITSVKEVTCKPEQQNYNGVCMSQRVIEYIVCVQGVEGGKDSTNKIIEEYTNDARNFAISGKAKVISGTIELGDSNERKIINKIETKFSPGARSDCLKALPESYSKSAQEIYITEKRNDDLRFIRDHLAIYGKSSFTVRNEAKCEVFGNSYADSKVEITNESVTVVNRQNSEVVCQDRPNFGKTYTELKTCTARLANLDESITTFSGGHDGIVLQCLSGECAECQIEYMENEFRPHKISDPYKESDLRVYNDKYTPTEALSEYKERITPLMRAFARVISSGSDAKLCKNYNLNCS
ncbi:MAG: hypothetical protein HOP04_11085 [Methylophilaceae bacterium]|nr:hypothetical protein [Methylophilaceae bacterium]